MAAVIIGLDPDNPPTGSVDKDRNTTYTFPVKLQSTGDPSLAATYIEVVAALAADNWKLGATCPIDILATASRIAYRVSKRRKPAQGVTYWEWTADITYSSNTGKTNPSDAGQKDPLLRPPQISFDTEDIMVPAKTFDTGDAPVNSAGDPIPREMPRSRTILRAQKNFASYPWPNTLQAPTGFKNSRNLDDWTPPGPYTGLFGSSIVLAGQALLRKISLAYVFENNTQHVSVSVEILIGDATEFADALLDQGWFEWPTRPSGSKVRIVDTSGFQAGPYLLNGSGVRATGFPPTPSYRSYNYFPTKDWSTLGF